MKHTIITIDIASTSKLEVELLKALASAINDDIYERPEEFEDWIITIEQDGEQVLRA